MVRAGTGLMILCMVALGACATSGPEAPGGPLVWDAGRYEVRGEVRYRADSEISTRTERMQVRAEVEVGPDGPSGVESSTGNCRRPPLRNAQQERATGIETFICGDATFTLRPSSPGITGEASLAVTETIRGPRQCERYETDANGTQRCVRYTSIVRTQASNKRVRLLVRRMN